MTEVSRRPGGPQTPGAPVQTDQVTILGDGSHGRPLRTADAVGGLRVLDEGQSVPGGPHRTLDFVGLGIRALDAGDGVARVEVPGGFLVEQDGVAIEATPHVVLDFTGAGVRALDAGGGIARVEVSGGVRVQDEGVPVDEAPSLVLNFTGSGVTVTDRGGGVVDVDVPTATQTADRTVLWWGLGAFTTTPAFVQFGGTNGDPSDADRSGVPLPFGGTLRDLFARHNTAGGGGDQATATYTVLVNGAATALSVSVSTGAVGQVGDVTHSVFVERGDVVSLRVDSDSEGPGVVDAKISLGLYA